MEHAAALVLISSKSKMSSSFPSGFFLRPNYWFYAVLAISSLDSREGTIFPGQMKFRNKELIYFLNEKRD